nr:lysyl oxidase homolog 2 [Anolis sagrei ordinatus]
MARFLDFILNHCLATLFLSVSLSQLTFAQDDGLPKPHPDGGASTPKIQVRLVNSKTGPHEGRLEILYNSEWGTVCDDDFSMNNAHVVCRELGYREAISWMPGPKYGQGEGRIWLDNVHCTGRETSLAQCRSNGWGVTDCRHTEDVSVICSNKRIPGFTFDDTWPNQNVNIRVEDARLRPILGYFRKRIPVSEGQVEVKVGGVWKQICDAFWTQKNSRVICGMFGFPSEKKFNAKVYKIAAYRRKHNYWAYSVDCTGNESHLSSCKLGRHLNPDHVNATCDHGMPVVVSCLPGRAFAPSGHPGFRKAYRPEHTVVRLKGGALPGEGRVEVMMNGEWGTICDNSWDLRSANVICREIGFGTAKEAVLGARMGKGLGPIHFGEVDCIGSEKSITDCKFNTQTLSCTHQQDAGVKCNVPDMGYQNQIRLVGGRTPTEGQVQISRHYNGTQKWGTVCSENWGILEAMVVCRQLGLGYAGQAFQDTGYWYIDNGVNEVLLSGVKCSDTEVSLWHCRHDSHVNCPKGSGRYAAGVSCAEAAADLIIDPKEVEHSCYLEERPMYMLQCAQEENCLSSSAVNTSVTDGSRRLMRFSTMIHNTGTADFRPKYGPQDWTWHECHRHYHSMEVFTHYDLLDQKGKKVAEGHKASFCLEDSGCSEGIEPQYGCYNFGEQGITSGCYDIYQHGIDCQWIDVTDVKTGDYILQLIVNPNYEVAETDFTNNIMRCKCKYDFDRIWLYECHTVNSYSDSIEEKFNHQKGLMTNLVS